MFKILLSLTHGSPFFVQPFRYAYCRNPRFQHFSAALALFKIEFDGLNFRASAKIFEHLLIAQYNIFNN